MGGFGGGTTGIWFGVGMKLQDPVLAIAMWGGTVALTFLTARGLFGRTTRKREEEIRTLAESIANVARESIDAAKPKPPRPR
jgi:hypothetical protein